MLPADVRAALLDAPLEDDVAPAGGCAQSVTGQHLEAVIVEAHDGAEGGRHSLPRLARNDASARPTASTAAAVIRPWESASASASSRKTFTRLPCGSDGSRDSKRYALPSFVPERSSIL